MRMKATFGVVVHLDWLRDSNDLSMDAVTGAALRRANMSLWVCARKFACVTLQVRAPLRGHLGPLKWNREHGYCSLLVAC